LSPRNEDDIVEIYSGVQGGFTLGTPIGLIVKNLDVKKSDYTSFLEIPRPGHADFTYLSKYGIKSSSGGGRSSARETISRVAGGAIAEKVLEIKFNTEIIAWVKSVGNISIPNEINNEIIKSKLSKEYIDKIGTFHVYIINEDKYVKKEEFILSNEFDQSCYYLERISTVSLNEHIQFNIIDKLEDKLNTEQLIEDKIDKDNKKDKDNKIVNTNNSNKPSNTPSIKPKEIIYKDNKYTYFESINTRCPHIPTAINIIKLIMQVKLESDSIGGIVSCVIKNCPQSLGEPCFDKFEASLAKAMLSIPATKGFEIGSGFEGTKLKGSQHNDCFTKKTNRNNISIVNDKLTKPTNVNELSIEKIDLNQKSNNSGGTLGGITTGEDVYFNVAIKPVSTIGKPQYTCDLNGKDTILEAKGRHDPCVVPRAIPIVEAMAALVIADFYLQNKVSKI